MGNSIALFVSINSTELTIALSIERIRSMYLNTDKMMTRSDKTKFSLIKCYETKLSQGSRELSKPSSSFRYV